MQMRITIALVAFASSVYGQAFTLTSNRFGNCQVTNGGNCFSEGPGSYPNNDACTWTTNQAVVLNVRCFSTESGFDRLVVNGVSYSGAFATGPAGVSVAAGSTISWSSDSSVTSSGFDICANGGSTSTTTCGSSPVASPVSSPAFSPAFSPVFLPTISFNSPASLPALFGPAFAPAFSPAFNSPAFSPNSNFNPPPPPFGFGGGNTGSSTSNAPSNSDKSLYWGRVFGTIIGMTCCVCCCASLCLFPCRSKIATAPLISPGVWVGILALVLGIAMCATTNTIKIELGSQSFSVSTTEYGMFNIYVKGSGLDETKENKCRQDKAPTDNFDSCLAGNINSDCCKATASKCKATQAFAIIAVLCTSFAIISALLRRFVDVLTMPKAVPVALAFCAAVSYYLVAAITLGYVFGYAIITTSNGGLAFNTDNTCGPYNIPNSTLTLSAGWFLAVISSFLSAVMGGMFIFWGEDETGSAPTWNQRSDASAIQNQEARSRAETAGHTNINPLYVNAGPDARA